jgi:hypothetical protein
MPLLKTLFQKVFPFVKSTANVSKFRFNETLPLKIDISAADGLPGMEGADEGGGGRRYGIP